MILRNLIFGAATTWQPAWVNPATKMERSRTRNLNPPEAWPYPKVDDIPEYQVDPEFFGQTKAEMMGNYGPVHLAFLNWQYVQRLP